jgi:hypothetical protein
VYTPGTPQLATITNGSNAAPWNEWQGDPATPAYSSVGSGTVLPTYTPGGAQTGSGATAEPNVAVMPASNSGTDGNAPYPSGTVGTPGPLSGYCGTGDQPTASAGAPSHQPAGTTLPLAPAYFPHIARNSDGSLTGYFDYRPKDADEAVEVARSTDGGQDWTYQGEALEQNPGYCPSGDVNDDGNGHPFVLTVGGVTRLYTLQRAAGDQQGVGMLVHALSPTDSQPLAGAPATESVGIDPDAFVPSGDDVTVPHTGGTTITLTTTGSAGSSEQLVAGGFVDLTQTPTPTASSVITCSGAGSSTLTGCTAANSAGETVAAGDLIEQVIGFVSGSVTVPAGPNTSTGDGGLGTINIVTTSGGSTKGFTNAVTGTTYNNNAPNRAYVNGVAVYCDQSNANPTTKMEDCTTGPGGSSLSVASGAPVTADPIIPSTASMTTGLAAPDGIIGVLPSYPGAPGNSTVVMYTEKELNYFVAGTTTNSSSTSFGATIAFTPSAYEPQDLPNTISISNPVTVSIGDTTQGTIIPVTCTGLTTGATDSLTGCSVPAADSSDKYSSTSLIGAPGATTVPAATLALTGEGSTSTAKLFKNNEDLAVVRVAYTTNGVDFSSAGLDNGGIISGQSNGASNYMDLTNPTTNAGPANLNAYATPGTQDATEMRWAGSAGSIITNPDGTYGLFLSGSWSADGDSDAFNQVFYSSSTDGEHWTVPTSVVSTDYTFAASAAQDAALAQGSDAPLGISAYYSGRAYGPSVVQNPDGTLTMMFAGYRIPKTIANAGTTLGTNSADQYTIGATDPVAYRNILVDTLIASGVPTKVSVSSDGNPVVTGQPVTFTATVSAPGDSTTPTGTVEFSSGGTDLPGCASVLLNSAGTAHCSASNGLPAGTDDVVATYSGDAAFDPSDNSSDPYVETVNPASTSTSLLADHNPAVTGQSVTLTATVGVNSPGTTSAVPPTGAVEFQNGGHDIAGCSAVAVDPTGTAQCSLPGGFPAGAQPIVATYSGDTNFAGSSSDQLNEQVNAAATSTALNADNGSLVTGQAVTFTATVSVNSPGSAAAAVPGGSVDFQADGADLPGCAAVGIDSGGTATCTVPGGFTPSTQTITAAYSGDENFTASDAPSLSEPVTPDATTTEVTASANPPVTGQGVVYTATVSPVGPGSGTPTGTATFTVTGPKSPQPTCTGGATVTLAGGSASCVVPANQLIPGSTYSVAVTYSGDSGFQPSNGTLEQTIAQGSTSTALVSSINPAASGTAVSFKATVSANSPAAGTPGGTVTFSVTGADGSVVDCNSSNTVTLSDATAVCRVPTGQLEASSAPYTVEAVYSGSVAFTASSMSLTQRMTKAPTTTTIKQSSTRSAAGAPVTFTATVRPTPAAVAPLGGSVTFTVTGQSGDTVPCNGSGSGSTSSGGGDYVATCTVSSGVLKYRDGPYQISAVYSGDGNDKPSSATATHTVTRPSVGPGQHSETTLRRASVGAVFGVSPDRPR